MKKFYMRKFRKTYKRKNKKVKLAKRESVSFFSKKRKNLYSKILLILILYIFLFCYNNNNSENVNDDYILSWNKTIDKDINEEYNDAQIFMEQVMNGTEFYKNKKYYVSNNPKLSIVITVYNGEAYLKTILLSIQNQDFKDVEIVIIDDCSKDNSVNLIKKLMKTEPRIVLYKNKENKGMLYTKTKGVLLSRGKYVMLMDEDDIYVQKEAFSTLYVEAEKNNLDILGFVGLHTEFTSSNITRDRPDFSDRKRIIYQPELSNLMYGITSDGIVYQKSHGTLWNHLIRTDLFKKVINQIDEKNLNERMNFHDDYILFFLLTRSAKSIKYIDRFFYVVYHVWKYDDKVKFRMEIKMQNRDNDSCFAYLNFLEILFKNTKNTYEDKKIAFAQLENWYLNKDICRTNKITRKRAIEVFKFYLDNEFVSKEDKKKLEDFINNEPN